VLERRGVVVEVEDRDECSRAIRRRQRRGLPPARRQPERDVLELRLRGRERDRQLAKQLRVGMKRVASLAPQRI
jgi:hypothetical protein